MPALALLTEGDFAFWLAVLLMAGMAALEIIRLRNKRANLLFTRTTGILMKERELNSITAATHMLIATVFCLGVFDKEVGALAILYTAAGDPSAATIGERFGRIKIAGKKTLEGSLAFAVAASAIALAVGLPSTDVSLVIAFAGVIAAALAELSPWRGRLPFLGPVDDNLLVPVAAAAVMSILVWL